MPRLHINIDHVATVRQARGATEPDPVVAAAQCELAGADGITVHLREDRRHVQERDVRLLKQTVKGVLNLELALEDEVLAIALNIRPNAVCVVPEKRQELTTEGGLDAVSALSRLSSVVPQFHEAGVLVSLFVDPDPSAIEAAAESGADFVELHTGAYANATEPRAVAAELKRLETAAEYAHSLELLVNAGHGLDYRNVRPIAELPHVEELNIGFAVVARAVYVGLDQAVREMLALTEVAG